MKARLTSGEVIELNDCGWIEDNDWLREMHRCRYLEPILRLAQAIDAGQFTRHQEMQFYALRQAFATAELSRVKRLRQNMETRSIVEIIRDR